MISGWIFVALALCVATAWAHGYRQGKSSAASDAMDDEKVQAGHIHAVMNGLAFPQRDADGNVMGIVARLRYASQQSLHETDALHRRLEAYQERYGKKLKNINLQRSKT